MKNKTIYIAFEGIDGSGKSVQFKLLKETLINKGKAVGVLDFPDYDSFFGKEIGRLLSGKDKVTAADLDPRSMSLWYAADRWNAFKSFDDSQYEIVLMNRSTMANAAYQGTRSEDAEALAQWIYELEFTTFGIPKPDVFFVFDIPTSLSRKNVAKKGFRGYVGDDADVYEKDVAFLEKVRNCYLSCAKLYPGSVVLNCADESEEMRPMDEIASDVLRILKEQFNIDI
ncbi:MAG: hypothetical protein IKY41_07380 [Clostridia bacterium]|nr:hypothetical protein [Clostridia bacterium]